MTRPKKPGRTSLHAARVASLVVAIASGGCAVPHVVLAGPDRSAPLDVRTSALNRLRPTTLAIRSTLYVDENRRVVYAQQDVLGLRLHSGVLVRAPEDLLPVVDEDSDTAWFARRAVRMRQRATWTGAIAGTLLGAGTLALGLSMGQFVNDTDTLPRRPLLFGAAFTGFGLGAMVPFSLFRARERASTRAAFRHYGEDVAEHLGYCIALDDTYVECGSR